MPSSRSVATSEVWLVLTSNVDEHIQRSFAIVGSGLLDGLFIEVVDFEDVGARRSELRISWTLAWRQSQSPKAGTAICVPHPHLDRFSSGVGWYQ